MHGLKGAVTLSNLVYSSFFVQKINLKTKKNLEMLESEVAYMEQVLVEAATTQGIWVLLFVALFIYTIKNNEKLVERQDAREDDYQKLLSEITAKYVIVEDIKECVDEIQKKVEKIIEKQ